MIVALNTEIGSRCNAGGALAPVSNVVTPKVFIISMFEPEGNVWYDIADFDLYARNITVPGLSPLYPDVHCTADGSVCELITGESGEWLSIYRCLNSC